MESSLSLQKACGRGRQGKWARSPLLCLLGSPLSLLIAAPMLISDDPPPLRTRKAEKLIIARARLSSLTAAHSKFG